MKTAEQLRNDIAAAEVAHELAHSKMIAAREADNCACAAFADRTETFAAYRTAERSRRAALGKLTKAKHALAAFNSLSAAKK